MPDERPATWRPVSRRGKALSLAVYLVDDFTRGPPIGEPTVTVDETEATPTRTPSGFFVFVDADLPSTVTVHVDGGAFYRDVRDHVVNVRARRTADPPEYEEVLLEPTPAYPFPNGTTLFRGTVVGGDPRDEDWVAGATVSVDGLDVETTTTEQGEFALYPERDDGYRVRLVDMRWLVRINGAHPVVRVTPPGGGGQVSSPGDVPVVAGTTASFSFTVP